MPLTASEPIVLIPGLLCDERVFAQQIPYLNTGVRQVYVPALGYFDSIEAMAQYVLDAGPEQFAVCGFSMGGTVALEIVRQAPHRVTRLAVLSAHARPDDDDVRARRHAAIDTVVAGGFEPLCSRLLTNLLAEESRNDQSMYTALLTMMSELGPDVFIRHSWAMAHRQDTLDAVRDLQRPVLVMSGELDAVSPVPLQKELATVARGRHVVLKNAAHVVTHEVGWAVNYWIGEWLRAR